MKKQIYLTKGFLWSFIKISAFYGAGFYICNLLASRYGHFLFAWHSLEDIRYWLFYWLVCCGFVFFRRNRMYFMMKISFFFSILATQVTGYLSVQKSILHFDNSELILPLIMISFLIIGIIYEPIKNFKQIEKVCFGVIILINLFAICYFINIIRMHIGAEQGYLSGYEQGVKDGEMGINFENHFGKIEKVIQEGFSPGSAEWSGYLQYYSSGYSAGYDYACNEFDM